MSLKTEIRREDGYWSLYVNGQRTVDRESFAVADRVKYFLDNPKAWEPAESHEVAQAIRDHFAKQEGATR
jgi:hypothetical protein